MAKNIDVSGFSSDRYFARAWRLVTQKKGWWKPILIMCVALLVPIVGPLAVLGYQLEWARQLAWDVNDPMPRRGFRVRSLIVSGWRGFLAVLGWGIAYVLIDSRISDVPGIGGVLDLAWKICGIFITMMIMVAAIRATIYQSASAGYSVKNLWEMARRDLGGLARVWAIGFTATVIETVISVVILLVGLASMISGIVYDVNILYTSGATLPIRELTYYIFDLIDILLNGLWPSLMVVSVIALLMGTVSTTLTFAALALWMRQFDIPAWGKSADPLPESVVQDVAKKGNGTPAAPVLPVAPAQLAEESVVDAAADGEKEQAAGAEPEAEPELETEPEPEAEPEPAPVEGEATAPVITDGPEGVNPAEGSEDADTADEPEDDDPTDPAERSL